MNKAGIINDLIRDAYGILLVTCGMCGAILSLDGEEIRKSHECKCKHCGYKSDYCNFPDLFYDN